MESRLYFRKLDTLRFFAFFLVFWQHAFSDYFINFTENPVLKTLVKTFVLTGGVGVHVFFVISGFLITFLMIKEERYRGKINVKYFYIRRILRIWPLYYFIVIIGIFLLPICFDFFHFNGNLPLNLLFLNNFNVYNEAPNVAIAWSVAIEEQFYLFWPLIFILFRNKNLLLLVSFVLFVFSLIFVVKTPYMYSYYHTFGNIRFLMTGCIGAILYTKYNSFFSGFFLMKRNMHFLIILIGLILLVFSNFYVNVYYISYIGLPIVYILLVLFLVNDDKSNKVSVFSKLGKYTYGMYLYHPTILIFMKAIVEKIFPESISHESDVIIIGLVSLVFTIIISILSYNFVEKHILSLKNKFSFIETRI